ncbi:MAG: hypothetical protein IJL71_04105 [Oscillospiraceae bacterium]|nr:hypothetical protein [Oscillospiraceae bacterium]
MAVDITRVDVGIDPYILCRCLFFYRPCVGYPNLRRRREGAEALPYAGMAVIRTRPK